MYLEQQVNAVAPTHSMLISEENKASVFSMQTDMTATIYLNILQLLPEPILILTSDTVVSFANHAARDFFSPANNDLQGKSFSSFLAQDSEKFNRWIQRVIGSSTFVSEQVELTTFRGRMACMLEGCAIRDRKHIYILIRLNTTDAEHSNIHTLSVQVNQLRQEIAMRRAAEERLHQSLVELERAKQQLEQLATVDSLTGIPNRRSIDEILQREWLKAMRNSEPLALIMIDIDYFKNYNDYYGHQAGDLCLKQVAHAIRSALRRPTDYVGRYGGEEFLILLTHTDWEKAKIMAERIFETIRLLKLPHLASPISQIVTISAGISVMIPLTKLSLSTLIYQADEALYQAKHNGRNQFVLHQKHVKTALHA